MILSNFSKSKSISAIATVPTPSAMAHAKMKIAGPRISVCISTGAIRRSANSSTLSRCVKVESMFSLTSSQPCIISPASLAIRHFRSYSISYGMLDSSAAQHTFSGVRNFPQHACLPGRSHSAFALAPRLVNRSARDSTSSPAPEMMASAQKNRGEPYVPGTPA